MVYVLSDIHGNERRFESVLAQIGLKPEDTLYVLGDVIDRYDGGIRLLQRLLAMSNVHLLLGNHEYMMLRALGHPRDGNADDGGAMAHWYRNGGEVTHRCFLELPPREQAALLDALGRLPLSFELTLAGSAYKLVHAALRTDWDGNTKYKSDVHFAVWHRLEGTEPPPEGYTLIFGHTPTRYFQDNHPMELWRDKNRIGIDCGGGYPEDGFGRLACLRLDDGMAFYSEEIQRKTEQ